MLLPYKFKVQDLIEAGLVHQTQIDTIRLWLHRQTNEDDDVDGERPIPKVIPDELIGIFLISCDGNINFTKRTMRAYYRIKSNSDEMFNGRCLEEDEKLVKAANTCYTISMPRRLPGNIILHWFGLKDTKYSNFDLVYAMKLAFMLLDISQIANPPNEIVVVMDMKGAGIMHLSKIRLGPLKIFLEFVQNAMPLKINQVIILNANFVFEKALSLSKAFIKSELMAMIKSFPPGYNMDDFYANYIGCEYLPKEYGGNLGTLDELQQQTVDQFRELSEFYKLEEKMRLEN